MKNKQTVMGALQALEESAKKLERLIQEPPSLSLFPDRYPRDSEGGIRVSENITLK